MRRTRISLAFAFTMAVLVPLGAGPASADGTTISLGTTVTSVVQVSGSVTYGTDATGNLTLGTDVAGDAVVSNAGLDLASLSVRPDIANRRLIWTLATHDGLPAPIDGPAPAMTAFMVPLAVDGTDWWRWLGAGTPGSATGNLSKWTGLCHNEASSGTQGGWGCPGTLAGSNTYTYSGAITQSGVTWTQPFGQMKPAIDYGSSVEQGSILCGGPCSFPFPPGAALGGLAPVDKIDFWESYRVPGKIELGITSGGTPPTASTFTTMATTANGTSFTGSLPKPAAAGTYTVWAKTCFGLAESPTCVLGSSDFTV